MSTLLEEAGFKWVRLEHVQAHIPESIKTALATQPERGIQPITDQVQKGSPLMAGIYHGTNKGVGLTTTTTLPKDTQIGDLTQGSRQLS